MFEKYSQAALVVMMFARMEAGRVGAKNIDTEHLLIGVMRADPVTLASVAPELTVESVRERAATWQTPEERIANSVDMPMSEDTQRALEKAISLAETCNQVRTEHLLLALMTAESSHSAQILAEVKASVKALAATVAALPVDAVQLRPELAAAEFFEGLP